MGLPLLAGFKGYISKYSRGLKLNLHKPKKIFHESPFKSIWLQFINQKHYLLVVKFWKSMEHLIKHIQSRKSSEARNYNNDKVFYEDFKMKPTFP